MIFVHTMWGPWVATVLQAPIYSVPLQINLFPLADPHHSEVNKTLPCNHLAY